ncbi:MAG: NfeD family protein [Clostridia bacterium]|nr:NfeD family protein [Clostridia bacterium]
MPDFFAANLPIILCCLAGIVFAVVEAFIPGFGIAGIGALLCEGAAVVLTWSIHGYGPALWLMVIIIVLMALILFVSMRSAAKGRLSRSKLILKDTESDDAGYSAVEDYAALMDKTGTTLTTLRPAGMAAIDGKRCNVVSEGGFVAENTAVRVIGVEGTHIIVREE